MSTSGYTRQSAADIQAGLPVDAVDFNNEFNQLQTAFDNTVGHDHSGSVTGTSQPINLTTAVTGVLPQANGGTGTTGGISLTSGVTGILPIANGGTNLAAGTAGGVLGFTTTTTLASSALLTDNALMIGGGSSATPSTITPGTTGEILLGASSASPEWLAAGTTGELLITTTSSSPSWLTAGVSSQILTSVGTTVGSTTTYSAPVWSMPFINYLGGLILSNDGSLPNSVLDIEAGCATDSTNTVLITIGAFTKSIAGSWVSGTGQDGMGNGLTATDSTWYHVILANNGGTPDIYFDSNVSGVNRPSGITDTKIRRIGSIYVNSSGHISTFSMNGDEVLWVTPIFDANNVTMNNETPITQTLTVPPSIKVHALIHGLFLASSTGSVALLFYSPDRVGYISGGFDATNIVPAGSYGGFWNNIRTNTSSQINAVSQGASGDLYLFTDGYIDTRGKTS